MTAILGACAGVNSTSSVGGGGGGGVSVSITDQVIWDTYPGDATASYQLGSNGTVTNQDSTVLETWTSGTASNYEAYVTVSSGTLSFGTTGSWLNLGTSRVWGVTNSLMNNSVRTVVLSVSIRLASSGVVQDTATITLHAESNNFY